MPIGNSSLAFRIAMVFLRGNGRRCLTVSRHDRGNQSTQGVRSMRRYGFRLCPDVIDDKFGIDRLGTVVAHSRPCVAALKEALDKQPDDRHWQSDEHKRQRATDDCCKHMYPRLHFSCTSRRRLVERNNRVRLPVFTARQFDQLTGRSCRGSLRRPSAIAQARSRESVRSRTLRPPSRDCRPVGFSL
jgi:hypothetical protein